MNDLPDKNYREDVETTGRAAAWTMIVFLLVVVACVACAAAQLWR